MKSLLAGLLWGGCLLQAHGEITADDLLSYWPFEGSLADVVGERHGALLGESTDRDVIPSPVGSGIRLDGVSQFIEIPNGIEDNITFEPKTLSFWLRPEDQPGMVFARQAGGWNLAYRTDPRSLGGGAPLPPPNLHGNGWHFVVVHPSGIFIDGKPASFSRETMLGFPYQSAPFRIGAPISGSANHFKGGIEEMALFRRALTVEEIGQLWNEGKGRRVMDLLKDEDKDSLPDFWEEIYFGGLAARAENDNDFDGLSNRKEWLAGTNPRQPDTDRDGLFDGAERSEPAMPDSDLDGLTDGDERSRGLDPLIPDTDGDGFDDGDEVKMASDPLRPVITPNMNFGLQGYWPFDSDLKDRLGKRDARPLQASVKFTKAALGWEQGLALDLDGKSGYEIPHETLDFLSNHFSVSLWYSARQVDKWSSPMVSYSGERFWWLGALSDVSAISFFQERHIYWMDGFPKQPRHLVATFDGDTGGSSIYLDGERLSSVQWPGGDFKGGQGLRIGAFTDDRSRPLSWNGLIDDLAIWDRPLTDSEARVIHRAGTLGIPLSELLARGDQDTDGDGMLDKLEKVAGTDPHKAADFLRVETMAASGGRAALRWRSVPGKRYEIERALTLPGAWRRIAGPIEASGDSTAWEGAIPFSGSRGFFRVAVAP